MYIGARMWSSTSNASGARSPRSRARSSMDCSWRVRSARLASRYGFRTVVTTGLALAGLGLLALGMVHADTGYANVCWRLGAVGTGFALTLAPLTGAAIQAVSPQEGGLASGISSTTRQIGAVLGVAVLGAVVRTGQSGGASFETGLNSAFVAAGAVTPATAVFTGLWLAGARPAQSSAAPRRSTDPDAVTTSNAASGEKQLTTTTALAGRCTAESSSSGTPPSTHQDDAPDPPGEEPPPRCRPFPLTPPSSTRCPSTRA